MDGIQNVILMVRMEEKLTPIKLKTWYSRTVSGCLDARLLIRQVHIETSAPIRDRVLWQGKRTVVHWVLFLVGGKCELWVIMPYGMSPAVYVTVVVLVTSPCGVS